MKSRVEAHIRLGPAVSPITFLAAIPMSRSISPITHTDWEGVGVQPDITVPSSPALAKAHMTALEKLQTAVISDISMREEVADAIERLRSELRVPR